MESKPELETTEEKTESATDAYGETDLRNRVAVAARVAEAAGEFKTLAFEKVLDRLLGARPISPPAEPTPTDAKTNGTPTRAARKSVGNRIPKASPMSVERVKPLLTTVSPDDVAEWAKKLDKLPVKYKPYGILAFARQFGLDGLFVAELREVATKRFRIVINDGSLRGNLSIAPLNEIGKTENSSGDVVYTILRDGEEALNRALAKADKDLAKTVAPVPAV